MAETLARDTSKESAPKPREKTEKFVNIEDAKLPGNHGWIRGVAEKVQDWNAKRTTKNEISDHGKEIDKATKASDVLKGKIGRFERERSALVQNRDKIEERMAAYRKPSMLDRIPGIAKIRTFKRESLAKQFVVKNNEIQIVGAKADDARKKWQESETTKSTYESKQVAAAARLYERFEKRLAPMREHANLLYEREAKLEDNIAQLYLAKEKALGIIAAAEKALNSEPNIPEARVAMARKAIDDSSRSIRKIDATLPERTISLEKCRGHIARLERAHAFAETSANNIKDTHQALFVEKAPVPSSQNESLWADLAKLLEGAGSKVTGENFLKSWNTLFGVQIDGKPLTYETLLQWYQTPDSTGAPGEVPEEFKSATNEHTAEEWKTFLGNLTLKSRAFKDLLQRNKLRDSSEAVDQITFLFA